MWKTIIENALKKQKAIINAAKDEGRGLTDDERKEFDNLTNKINEAKEMQELETGIENNTPAPAPTPQPTPAPSPVNTGEGVPTGAQNVRVTKNPETWENGIGSVLKAIANSSRTGVMDQRFANAAQGGNETVPADGGFLVGQTMVQEILKRVYDNAEIAGRCRKRPVSVGNRYVQNYIDEKSRKNGQRMGGIQAYWVDEAQSIPKSKPKIGQIDIKLNKLAGIYYASEELLADAAGLQAEVQGWFSDEFAFMLDDAILNGTGAGMPQGINNSNAVVSVAKEGGQAANTIVYENILNMWSRLWARGRKNAVWLINQDIEPQLNGMAKVIGTGGVPVYLPANGIADTPYATLMGRPVIAVEQAETLGTKGDISFVDLDSYLLIDKQGEGIKAAESIHVAFVTDERAFRFTYRVNGQPIWQSALTPAKGTKTLSAFVNLATRA